MMEKDSFHRLMLLDAYGGYTWTLPSRLGRILREVEELYGLRDSSWTVLGIEFGPRNPHLWYPSSGKNIVIQLGMSAIDHAGLARYQLAHECVHLLAPNGGGKEGPVIERGG